MPMYEYECLDCTKTFDAIQKFSDPEITECRFCGSEVRRLVSKPAIIFKGDGWYCNEFPTADRKKGLEADKKASSGVSAPACAANCDKACG